jgi:hypothetical protein
MQTKFCGKLSTGVTMFVYPNLWRLRVNNGAVEEQKEFPLGVELRNNMQHWSIDTAM